MSHVAGAEIPGPEPAGANSGPGIPPAEVSAPAFGRLLSTELHRFSARRFVRLSLLLALLGYLLLIGLQWQQHHRVTPADTAQATAQRDRTLAEFRKQAAQCASTAPAGQAEEQCGTAPSEQDLPVEQFLSARPFTPQLLSDTALGLGVATAALGFVLGATFIGAEWSSRNIVAWLFWEPRRLRLLAAKVLALLAVMLALSLFVQLSWAVIGRVVLRYRGLPVSSLGPQAHRFSVDLAWLQVRAGLLVVVAALLAFGLAHLLRNSAAAFGIAFVYFVPVELAVQALRQQWTPYLLTPAIGAWVSKGGLDLTLPPRLDRRTGQYVEPIVHLSNIRGGVTLLIYVALVLGPAAAAFRRRDIS